MRVLSALLLVALSTCTTFAQVTAERDGVPADPIAPQEAYGCTNAIVLRNSLLAVTIFPTLGRIGALRFGELDNLLRFDTNLAVWAATHEATDDNWRNFGGDWLWPVSQAHWETLFGRNWPPQTFIDGLPWQARAWISDNGSQTCLLTLEVGAPLHIAVQRKIHLDPETATVTIVQRIERTAASEAPVTLWNISQVVGAHRVVVPVDDLSAFSNGFKVLDFTAPPSNILSRAEGGVLLMDVQAGTEHKIGTDSPRGWIAAQREGVLLLEQAVSREADGTFPDGGCRVELYANSGLGYTEIETLSEERNLAPGESLENTLTLSLYRVAPDLADDDLAKRIRSLLGEAPSAPAPSP